MDLSKLPKFSQPDRDPDSTEPAPAVPAGQFCDQCGAPVGAGARFCPGCGRTLGTHVYAARDRPIGPEAWLSIAIGAILWFLHPNLTYYIFHPSTNRFDATLAGTHIPYLKSAFFWPDLGMTAFCLCLIVGGVLLLMWRTKWSVLLVIFLSGLAAVLNMLALIIATPLIGFNLFCAMAVAYSIYILITQVGVLKGR